MCRVIAPISVFFLFLTFFNREVVSNIVNEKRIINGVTAPYADYKWAAFLKGKFPNSERVKYCSGAIIDKNYILTAAHCFEGITDDGDNMTNPAYWHIQTGSVNVFIDHEYNKDQIMLGPTVSPKPAHSAKFNLFEWFLSFFSRKTDTSVCPVLHSHAQKIIIHPNYTRTTRLNDLALMELNTPLPLDFNLAIEAIELPSPRSSQDSAYPQSNSACIIIGWGCTTPNGPVSAKAQLAVLEPVDYNTCLTWYNNRTLVNSENQFCAGQFYGNRGICRGDDGAILACPFNRGWAAAGVASIIRKLSPESYPGIFARVEAQTSWILNVIKYSTTPATTIPPTTGPASAPPTQPPSPPPTLNPSPQQTQEPTNIIGPA